MPGTKPSGQGEGVKSPSDTNPSPAEVGSSDNKKKSTRQKAPLAPNIKALAILQAMKESQASRPFSDSTNTLDFIREARSGGMYGEIHRGDDDK